MHKKNLDMISLIKNFESMGKNLTVWISHKNICNSCNTLREKQKHSIENHIKSLEACCKENSRQDHYFLFMQMTVNSLKILVGDL